MPLLLKYEYKNPRKFYKQHIQDLKYNTYTTEDLALFNHFALMNLNGKARPSDKKPQPINFHI
jgi:hypothetical protein